MIHRIYLDVDDVLNLLTMAALKYHGCPVEVDEFSAYSLPGVYDIVAVHNSFDVMPVTEKQFWDRLGREFWESVPVSPEKDWFIGEAVKAVGEQNVFLLTAIPCEDDVPNPSYVEGKLAWISANLPKFLQRQTAITHAKYMCAAKGHLLVDDADHNVEPFIEAGGEACLVPKPWNKHHCMDWDQWRETFFNLDPIKRVRV